MLCHRTQIIILVCIWCTKREIPTFSYNRIGVISGKQVANYIDDAFAVRDIERRTATAIPYTHCHFRCACDQVQTERAVLSKHWYFKSTPYLLIDYAVLLIKCELMGVKNISGEFFYSNGCCESKRQMLLERTVMFYGLLLVAYRSTNH